MKCEICKRETRRGQTLCQACADAIRRLAEINKPEAEETPRALVRGNSA